MPSVSDPSSKHVGQEQGKEETPGARDRPGIHRVSSFSGSKMHMDENEELIITSIKHISLPSAKIAHDKVGIRATDIALGLRRIPSGFHTMVYHSGLKWRTKNKCSSVNDDVVEWSGPIPM